MRVGDGLANVSAHLRAPAHPTSARTATALHVHARHSLALGLHSTLHSPPFVSFPGRSQCELSNEVRSAFGRAEFPFENRLNVPKIAHFFRCAKLKTTCSKNHLAHVQGTPDCGFSLVPSAGTRRSRQQARAGLDNTKYGRMFNIILIRIIRNTWSSQV